MALHPVNLHLLLQIALLAALLMRRLQQFLYGQRLRQVSQEEQTMGLSM
jgi:hypothetical protein